MKSTLMVNKKTLNNIKNKAFKVGFVHLLSANILLQIASFGGQIFLTRILSVEDIGRIKVLQSFLSNLTIIAGLGLNVAILKLCSERVSDEKRNKLFSIGLKLTIITSITVTVLTIIITTSNVFSSDSDINNLMKFYVLQIPFLVTGIYLTSYLQSQKKIHLISKIQSISKIVVVFVSILGAYLYGLEGYVLTLVISLSLTTLLFLPFIKSEIKSMRTQKFEKELLVSSLHLGGYSFITNLLGQLVVTLNILILNYVSNNQTEIGYYSIAHLIVTSMMILPNTLNQMMIPYISEQTGKKDNIKKILKKFEKRMVVITTILCTVAFFLVPLILPIIFGKEYIDSVPYFRILTVGLFLWGLYSPKGITLVSVGRVDINLKVNCIAFIVNIALNLILIDSFGAIGAAIATSTTYFITIFINYYYFKKADL